LPEPLAADDPTYAGSYRLVELLGVGSRARVFLGQGQDGGQVAVRLFPEGTRFRPGLSAELKVLRAAPTGLLDAGDDEGRPYLVSEYVHGETLAARLARQGPLTEAELRRTCVLTMAALEAVHDAGVAHRDLKPSKVLIAEDGIRLIGFGIPLVEVEAEGPYLSPEQAQGLPGGTPSDLFSWACVMVEAATGERPFWDDGRALLLAKPQLGDAPFPELFARCLAKDPASRPTAEEVSGMLAAGHGGVTKAVAELWLKGASDLAETLPLDELTEVLLDLAEARADEQEGGYDPVRGQRIEAVADWLEQRNGPSGRLLALRGRAHAAPVDATIPVRLLGAVVLTALVAGGLGAVLGGMLMGLGLALGTPIPLLIVGARLTEPRYLRARRRARSQPGSE
jgi:hypothetical protein